jgi:hypothetical protein
MTRIAIDYSKTIIYRIVCKDPSIIDCYVGSTTNFTKRKSQHKTSCTNSKDKNHHFYVYQFIRDNGNWDNWDMLEIEIYRAVNQPDQARRERYWLETYGATLNKQVPSRTVKEWCDENREQLLERNREYYKVNKEQILEHNKEYYQDNREQLLEKQKEYNEVNREQISEKNKEYYEKNKEQILEKYKEKNKEKITCECGSICSLSKLSRHKKSKKHLKIIIF